MMRTRGSILVVDDERELCSTLQDFFTEEGYQVDVAMNAGDALMLISLNRPDAVILDIRLPDRNGADLLADLMALDASIAVVMLSGSDDEALARATLKGGAFDYVRKPFDLDTLERAVSLAVTVGSQKPRRGVVLPFRSGRRVTPEAPAPAEGESQPYAPCAKCSGPILDNTAVVEKGVMFHAGCWLRLRRPLQQQA
jgi:DNA-binding response OmpR family regulator